jgi:hypothetical protein
VTAVRIVVLLLNLGIVAYLAARVQREAAKKRKPRSRRGFRAWRPPGDAPTAPTWRRLQQKGSDAAD